MYEYLPHTADLKIRVIADSLEELFSNSLKAINEFLQPKLERDKIKKDIKIISNDLISLYIDFLSEVLSLTYIEKRIFCVENLKIIQKNKFVLEATLVGEKFISLVSDIKGVTYHQANITKENNKYIGEFIIDI